MTLIATALKHLLAAGMTGDALIAAISEIENAAGSYKDEAAERRRARDREYQAERRRQISADSADTADIDDAAPSFDKESPQTPKKLNPSPCVSLPGAKVFHRLPQGWTPTRPLPSKTQVKADQWPPGALADELASLHRWGLNAKDENGKGRKKDWDAAWANWIERRHDDHYGRRIANGVGRHKPSDGFSDTTRAANAVFGTAETGDEHRVPQ